ncbi:uncharacterized protein [Triticum aestivum]|uniref:uncharacterized protein isoform X1 n=1 Tax=Triticum aestivum TaxID=4565 RepID=UPI001D01D88A|nr:uncharacterized protein LOC123117641 isoform X1 [Triticum aestivum]XP_044394367.1 uncharacterized protein LOC123117641 isoform X1 [Triticum aestivum]
MDWDILPCRAACWTRCGSPMLCSDGPPLLDGCRWLRFIFLWFACSLPLLWIRRANFACLLCFVHAQSGMVSCYRFRRALGPSLLLIEPTSPVTGASSSRPSCCLPNVLLLAASGCMISSVAASFDSSRKPQHEIVPPLAPVFDTIYFCRLFLMLQPFPVEWKGRWKKLQEEWCSQRDIENQYVKTIKGL